MDPQGVKKSIFDLDGGDAADPSTLEVVSLDANKTPIIPFTHDVVEVSVHFIDDPDLRGYVQCLGDGCVVCRVGRERTGKILLPVYAPLSRNVAVLSMGTSLKPGALRPQVLNHLRAGAPQVLFVTRQGNRFTVAAKPLQPGIDDGAAAIKDFVERDAAGTVDLTAVYPRHSNEQLRAIGQIANLLSLQGGEAP